MSEMICKYECYRCDQPLICDCTGNVGCGYETVGILDRRCKDTEPHCHYPKFCVDCYEAFIKPYSIPKLHGTAGGSKLAAAA